MSTPHFQTATESHPNRPTRTTAPEISTDPRTATDRAPRTFAHRDTARLENLIDEFNAAFADSKAR
ncbi:hypothetical protein [Natronorubrum halophilum]|uniref:hypothetical protein n=1 Tax=Natronorubrum halophilum TaxID=1702106 RepID=UPI000EF6E040|nr:hypothetical protein [Natronorubrum halophilum]